MHSTLESRTLNPYTYVKGGIFYFDWLRCGLFLTIFRDEGILALISIRNRKKGGVGESSDTKSFRNKQESWSLPEAPAAPAPLPGGRWGGEGAAEPPLPAHPRHSQPIPAVPGTYPEPPRSAAGSDALRLSRNPQGRAGLGWKGGAAPPFPRALEGAVRGSGLSSGHSMSTRTSMAVESQSPCPGLTVQVVSNHNFSPDLEVPTLNPCVAIYQSSHFASYTRREKKSLNPCMCLLNHIYFQPY